MNNKVLITFKSTHEIDGDAPQGIEFLTVGKYYKKKDKHYLTYEESDMTGFPGVMTTLRLDDEKVTMTRFGTPNTQMVFEKGQKHTGYYSTEYGGLMVGVKSNEVDVRFSDKGLDIYLDYYMEFENTLPTRNNIHVNVREAGLNDNS